MVESKEQKDKIVKDLINGFDFESVRSVMYLRRWENTLGNKPKKVPTIDELKKRAEKLIRLTFDHQDREFWWAGGLNGFGGLCACYDAKWGFSLNYIFKAKKVKENIPITPRLVIGTAT